MSTCSLPPAAPGASGISSTPASGLSSTGRTIALALLLGAAAGLTGCVAPYHPSGVVYSPAPGPSGETPVQSGQPQVVHSVQVPQGSLPQNGGYSVAEILAQVKSGRPVAELAADVRSRGLNAPLKQADVDMLATQGAPKEVVDAALAAPVNTATADNPQVVTRAYYYYPWVPLTLGLYWGAWRPFYYPYYSYSPRPRFWGHSVVPRYFGGGTRSLPPSGWGGRGGRFR